MQKIKIYITITLLFTTLLSAQGFKLSDYQAPEISRKALWLEAQSTTNHNYSIDGTFCYGGDIVVTGSLQFYGNHFFQSKKIETETIGSYACNSSNLAWIGNLKFNNISRWYYKDDFFIGCEPKVELNGYNSESMEKVDIDVTASLGWGRIEHTEDARLALYILEDLKDKELLAKYPTNEQISELAALITKLKNERFLDTREKKIYEITQLDAFFQTNNLLNQTNATYFTILTDNWDNCASPVRLNGMRLNTGMKYSNDYYRQETAISYNGSQYIPYSTGYIYPKTISPCLAFEWAKPLNLKWQLENTLKAAFNFNSFDSYYYVNHTTQSYEGNNSYYEYNQIRNDTNKTDFESASATNNLKLGYFPNSRNSIEGKLQLEYNWYNVNPIIHTALIGVFFNWNYYYSRNLRLNTTYKFTRNMRNEYGYDYDNYPEKKRITHVNVDNTLEIGITYSLF